MVLAWDDSDGQYDDQFPPNVHHSKNLARTPCTARQSDRPGAEVHGAGRSSRLRPRRPCSRCGAATASDSLLVVSPFARENHVDHTVVDQASVLRFIEDNWGLPRLGHGSFDAAPGRPPRALLGMFDFTHRRDDVLLLNHLTGNLNQPRPTSPIPR